MKKILFLYSLIASWVTFAQQPSLKQGINGKIYLRQGNYMPSPGQKANEAGTVKTDIWVYELTTREQAAEHGVYFSQLKTKPIAKGESNRDGYYAIPLPPGNYSVFVLDNDKLYANSFDGKGDINPVTVKKDSVSRKDIVINAKATY